jgi:hypothetical protein
MLWTNQLNFFQASNLLKVIPVRITMLGSMVTVLVEIATLLFKLVIGLIGYESIAVYYLTTNFCIVIDNLQLMAILGLKNQ